MNLEGNDFTGSMDFGKGDSQTVISTVSFTDSFAAKVTNHFGVDIDPETAEYLRAGGWVRPYPMTLSKLFKSHNHEYGIDEYGVIHQIDAKPYKYDASYVATYDTPEYIRDNTRLQGIRLKIINDLLPDACSILDVGYGNGAFLKAATSIPFRYGKDVTGVPVPGVSLTNDYIEADVITFWDCLEHIPDLSFVRDLKAKLIVVSLPWCHYSTKGQDWFDNEYKHRKPDEHLHHFDPMSLQTFMRANGWVTLLHGYPEDEIRKSPGDWPNILTMAFKRG